MKKKNSCFENTFLIILTIIMLVYFGHNNIEVNLPIYSMPVYQIFILILTAICGLKIIREKKIRIINKKYLAWLSTFIFMTIISIVWAIDSKYTYSAIMFIMFNFLMFFDILIYCDEENKVYNIIKIYLVAMIYMCIRLILFEDGRPGSMYFGNIVGLYFNNIAIALAFGIALSLLLYFKNKKLIYILPILLFYYVIYLTGSRKGLLLPIVFFIIFYFLNNKASIKKYINFLVIIMIGISIIYVILKNNETLRLRMAELFESFTGKEVSDYSVNERSFFRSTAMKLFLENPIIGIGINNFAAYMEQIGYSHVAYSHCNYTEILSNLGIIGFGIYYYIYGYIVVKSIKLFKRYKEGKPELYYPIALIFVLLIFEYGFVSYYILEAQIQIFICYLLISFQMTRKEENNEQH